MTSSEDGLRLVRVSEEDEPRRKEYHFPENTVPYMSSGEPVDMSGSGFWRRLEYINDDGLTLCEREEMAHDYFTTGPGMKSLGEGAVEAYKELKRKRAQGE